MSAPSTDRAVLRRIDWEALEDTAARRWLDGLRPAEPAAEVGRILDAVRQGGDAALRELVARHDGVELDELWVTDGELEAAEAAAEPSLRAALSDSIAALEAFHAEQLRVLLSSREVETRPGVRATRRFVPLRRAGGYIPAGRAALASSVAMLGVPARLAGVDELVLATPPAANGSVAPAVLVAARMVGVSRVLKAGGAQAIAALAYGTQSVPRVDRIFGAGGAWVTAAKRAVSASVSIDLPAGPSECIVLADAAADPLWVAHDLLAQAEHGTDSVALLVTDSAVLADAVDAELPAAAGGLATGQAALDTLRGLGWTVIVPSLDAGLSFAERVAPEHLSLQCASAAELAERVRCAGSVFVGRWTPVAAGDYATGTNHVLPTGGAARAWSGIGVEAFGRWVTVQQADRSAASALAATVGTLAEAEGLPAHHASVAVRAAAAGARR